MRRGYDCGYPEIDGKRLPELRMPNGTQAESQTLVRIILSNMGPECKCHPAFNAYGIQTALHVCPAHEFLNETDPEGRSLEWTGCRDSSGRAPHVAMGNLTHCVRRIDRLFFMRRMRDQLLAEEGALQCCPKCQAIYAGAIHECEP